MSEINHNNEKEFMIEKIKQRPLNRKKLLRRTIITALMAVIFGLVACFTFLILEPVMSNLLNTDKDPIIVTFPEDIDEISPEDMLTDNMLQENQTSQTVAEVMEKLSLDNNQIQSILDSVVLDKDDLRQAYNSVSNYTSELKKSMVTIVGITSKVDWIDNIEINKVKSHGVIIANNSKELLIVANYTPLKRADKLLLTFDNGLQVSAHIKDVNSKINIAIISVDLSDISEDMLNNEITIAQMGSSNKKYIVGTPVIALGNPVGTSDSINFGMVVGVENKYSYVDSNYKILQTNMIGSDNAEGIIFNFNGQVVGIITTDDLEIKNTIAAYGITELKNCIEKMSNGKKLPYIGIKGMDVTVEANTDFDVPYGGYVTEVEMDSPAMMAGIQTGDVIIAINDKSIKSYSDYVNILMEMNVGEDIKLKVLRQLQNKYKEIEFSIVVNEFNK